MKRLSFVTQSPIIESDPNRVDVACFVGFVRGRPLDELPASLFKWLDERHWPTDSALLDVPVPVDTWDTFDQLFAWEARAGAGSGTTYLGSAVRSFFEQGGRKCYVVRAGDSWSLDTSDDPLAQRQRLASLLPGYPGIIRTTALEPGTWSGVTHLFGLSDVTFVCLPDLPEIVGTVKRIRPSTTLIFEIPEQFVECSDPLDDTRTPLPFGAPLCEVDGYELWATALNRLLDWLLFNNLRTLQVLAAVPLPAAGSAAERHLLTFLYEAGYLDRGSDASPGIGSAFLQLAFPWIRTNGSAALPEQLEPPDGALCGILARNALAQGTYRHAATLDLVGVHDIVPILTEDQLYRDVEGSTLLERVSCIGITPAGLQLLSDVTAATDQVHRPASTGRLIGSLLRAGQQLGRGFVFDVNGERLWRQTRFAFEGLLLDLFQQGALRGRSGADAFTINCDRTTMTQNDIDNGRVVAEIVVNLSRPLEKIAVTLAIAESNVSVLQRT